MLFCVRILYKYIKRIGTYLCAFLFAICISMVSYASLDLRINTADSDSTSGMWTLYYSLRNDTEYNISKIDISMRITGGNIPQDYKLNIDRVSSAVCEDAGVVLQEAVIDDDTYQVSIDNVTAGEALTYSITYQADIPYADSEYDMYGQIDSVLYAYDESGNLMAEPYIISHVVKASSRLAETVEESEETTEETTQVQVATPTEATEPYKYGVKADIIDSGNLKTQSNMVSVGQVEIHVEGSKDDARMITIRSYNKRRIITLIGIVLATITAILALMYYRKKKQLDREENKRQFDRKNL